MLGNDSIVIGDLPERGLIIIYAISSSFQHERKHLFIAEHTRMLLRMCVCGSNYDVVWT